MIVEPCSKGRESGAEPGTPGRIDQVKRISEMWKEAMASE
ncbi:hypothetical protein RHI9324_01268 [Rhizobium sp. CECT 9324]|nr:hypothetical protein RHI9324_01268 [Rhizobium sp. CECT 9324]